MLYLKCQVCMNHRCLYTSFILCRRLQPTKVPLERIHPSILNRTTQQSFFGKWIGKCSMTFQKPRGNTVSNLQRITAMLITSRLCFKSWCFQYGNSQKILCFVQLCSFSSNPEIWKLISVVTLGKVDTTSYNISPEILRGGPMCMLFPLRKATLLALKQWLRGKNRRWQSNQDDFRLCCN